MLEFPKWKYALIVLVSVLGSAATAGTTGATVMLTLTLSTAGLPLEGMALLLAVDPIVDMGRTALNVSGQALIPALVAKQEGILDQARYDAERVSRGEMLSVTDVEEILAIPLLGVIPESRSVLAASNSGEPVILDEASDAGQAYDDAVARLLGEDLPHRFLTPAKKGFFARIFGG